MPAARAETIRVLARAVAVGELELAPSVPFETTRRRLGAIPGIGDWTVEYVAMRALRDPDAFPAGDLGLRRALGVSPREVSAWGERWRPWRAYAALHLWNAGDHLLREAA
jgi:AraC family transcriptional regulator of adaptative response / DNA-3-methyladenine glycosylase II